MDESRSRINGIQFYGAYGIGIGIGIVSECRYWYDLISMVCLCECARGVRRRGMHEMRDKWPVGDRPTAAGADQSPVA